MATQEDVRRIALSLPQTSQAADHFGFGVPSKGKLRGFAWAGTGGSKVAVDLTGPAFRCSCPSRKIP